MYCGYCGNRLKENGRFCGRCGSRVTIIQDKPKVVCIEDQPLPSLMNDGIVVLLTICILLVSIATIVFTSIFTKDYSSLNSSFKKVVSNEIIY